MPKKHRQKWRVLPDFPRYEINQYGDVRHLDTNVRLTHKEQFGKRYYELYDGEVIRLRHANDLLSTVPEFSF